MIYRKNGVSDNIITTEKILDPLLVNSIPVYWGNPLIGKDFNEKAFLNYSDFNSEDELIKKMLAIENDTELAIDMLQQPVFPENCLPEYIDERNVVGFLKNIISKKNMVSPVALSSFRYKHKYNRKKLILKHYLKRLLKKNFR